MLFRKNNPNEQPKRYKKPTKKAKPTHITITLPYEKWEKISKMVNDPQEHPSYVLGYLMAELDRYKENSNETN